MSRRVSFSSEAYIFGAPINVDTGNKKRSSTENTWIFKLPRGSSSAGKFFRNVGAKVSKALPMISTRRKCFGKVSSSPAASLARLRSYADAALDSQRAEAIEDCIEFFNNPSLQRSSSVNSSC